MSTEKRKPRPVMRRRREVYAVDVGPGGEALVMKIENPARLVASRGCSLSGDVVDLVADLVADYADPRKRSADEDQHDQQGAEPPTGARR